MWSRMIINSELICIWIEDILNTVYRLWSDIIHLLLNFSIVNWQSSHIDIQSLDNFAETCFWIFFKRMKMKQYIFNNFLYNRKCTRGILSPSINQVRVKGCKIANCSCYYIIYNRDVVGGAFSDFSLQVVLVMAKNALRWFW